MSSIITATDIFIRYGDRTVLDHATLGIEDGDRIGPAGLQAPDSGEVSQQRGAVVNYLPQNFILDAAMPA